MAVDQYGSYTNNDLIYEAITGNEREETGNTLSALNYPVIDASINNQYAIINMSGNALRFVSLDEGVTTPTNFNIPSAKITTIKAGLIFDITIPDNYIAYRVAALDHGILFSDFNSGGKVFVFKGDDLDVQVQTTSYDYIYALVIGSGVVYLTGDEIQINDDNFCFIGGSSSSSSNLVTESEIVNVTTTQCSIHDGKYCYVASNKIYVKGNFNMFSPTGDSTTSYNTFTEASIFSSYTINKAYVYGYAILALTSDNKLIGAGDNRNYRLTTTTNDELITTPVVIMADASNVNEIVFDNETPSDAAVTSYIASPTTLEEDNGTLNLEQNATNSSLRLSNTVQTNSMEAVETPSSSESTGGDSGSGESGSGGSGEIDMRYDTGQTKVITVTKDNLNTIDTTYSNEAVLFASSLEEYLETLAIGKTVTKQDLGAESIVTAVGGTTNITVNGQQVYYKILCTIEEHTADSTRVAVTIGPNVQWGTDSTLATNTALDLQYSQVIYITQENIDTEDEVYAASEELVKQRMVTYLKDNYLLGQVITADYLTASTINNYTNDASTIYYRPVYNIPTHTEYDESVTVTVGSTINYGTSESSLDKTYDAGNGYQYSIVINHSSVSTAPTTYGEKVALLQAQLDTYLDSLLSTTVTATTLGADTVRSYTIANTSNVIYYRPVYNIPDHSPDDQSVTISVGSEIEWGYSSNNLDQTYDAGNSHDYTITITRANLSNATTLYTEKADLLQAELNTYIINNLTLGSVVTATTLGAETVRSYSSTSTGTTVYYTVTYSIPTHVANDFEVVVTVGSSASYGYANNALSKTYDLNQTYTITLNHDNIANATTLFTEKANLLQALLETHIAAVILNTVVTASSAGASTIRSFTATTSTKTVFYRPIYNIPEHTAHDEELTITIGADIEWGYSNTLDKTYTATGQQQTINLTRSNVANVATLYTAKADILQGLLDAYLTTIKLDKVVTSTDLGSETVRQITTTKAQETIYYKVEYSIGEHTANDTEVQVTLGPYIDWGYEQNEV